MNKTILIIAALYFIAFASAVAWEQVELLPQPEFEKRNFLLNAEIGIEEMNVDFAIAWTDSAASFFVLPFDAVILHTEVEGEPRDIFVISDAATNRLMVWMCTAAEGSGERELLTISAYYGPEEQGTFNTPSGLATNAINREFKPDQDVIYVADRGNNRIVELRYFPNEEGGEFVFNRLLGDGYLEWPVDVAISAYGDQDLYTADLYVVDWGHERGAGELVRINILNGDVEGSWHDVLYPQSTLVLAELNKPVSVACFPYAADSSGYFTAIYITEEVNNPVYLFKAQTDDEPEWCDVNMLENGDFIRQPGGLAHAYSLAKNMIELAK